MHTKQECDALVAHVLAGNPPKSFPTGCQSWKQRVLKERGLRAYYYLTETEITEIEAKRAKVAAETKGAA